MATIDATVFVPTHDHGPLVELAVDSALRQTLQSFEIFIVGDGVPDAARPFIERLVARDGRIRFFDFPKRGRTGEPHRNAVLSEARGRAVCYLADDDLWLPDHLERLVPALDSTDFVHSIALRVYPDGHLETLVVDLANPRFRQLVVEGSSRIHFSGAGHSLDLFRRLPYGWRETPAGIPTDYYMWRHVLEQPDVSASTLIVPTALVFPSALRSGSTADERLAELQAWHRRLSAPGFVGDMRRAGFSALCEAWLEQYAEGERRLATLEQVHRGAAGMREAFQAVHEEAAALRASLERTHDGAETLRDQLREKDELIQRLHEEAALCRDELARLKAP
jgi:hypothetical protein